MYMHTSYPTTVYIFNEKFLYGGGKKYDVDKCTDIL